MEAAQHPAQDHAKILELLKFPLSPLKDLCTGINMRSLCSREKRRQEDRRPISHLPSCPEECVRLLQKENRRVGRSNLSQKSHTVPKSTSTPHEGDVLLNS